ncbi:MAG: hypothetical protein DWQ47_08120 [Acidobacteria bacterium]|nr:MAG: hypothetical protein DWQ32_16220 [Acidobacteriota bacterium]REJ99122.1 MAG: hypothetical protein DWQ38_13755 [Acidobacteriota bacterium]REK43838.1 MAG: hypothetical protein DWQ47_08120 [Acidobacteriota bacterium]
MEFGIWNFFFFLCPSLALRVPIGTLPNGRVSAAKPLSYRFGISRNFYGIWNLEFLLLFMPVAGAPGFDWHAP